MTQDLSPETPITDDDRLRCRERPNQFVVMKHRWEELLFLHWEFAPEIVQRLLPAGLKVDTFHGRAFVGVVPFLMRRIRPRWLPAVPWISNFHELNVRTYVIDPQGRPGVWFFSLDADQPLGVWCGKNLFGLPYVYSQMKMAHSAERRVYRCQRRNSEHVVETVYTPRGAPAPATIGTLEFFLIERYLMFIHSRSGHLSSGQVWHPPYAISRVDLEHWDATPLSWNGFSIPDRCPDHAAWSPAVDVDIFGLKPCVDVSDKREPHVSHG